MGQYRPMFNIALEHTYFNDGRFPGVTFTPTAESERLMLNNNLITRKRNDGITVFFDSEHIDSLKLYAEDADDPLRINFECDSEHSNFQNFTISSIFEENKTLFFDSTNTDGSDFGKKYLHVDDFVSSQDLVKCFNAPTDFDEDQVSVMDFSATRKLIFDSQQTESNPHGKRHVDSTDPSTGEQLQKNVLASRKMLSDTRKASVGLFSILITPDELSELHQGSTQSYNDYHVRFQARETYWKYYLVGDANQPSAYIKDIDGKVEFEDLGEELLSNGKSARIFISKQTLPLQARAKQKFQLLVKKNGRTKVYVRRLAVASAKRINKQIVNGNELFVSEIYINF